MSQPPDPTTMTNTPSTGVRTPLVQATTPQQPAQPRVIWHELPGVVIEPLHQKDTQDLPPRMWISPSIAPVLAAAGLTIYALVSWARARPIDWGTLSVSVSLFVLLAFGSYRVSRKHRSNLQMFIRIHIIASSLFIILAIGLVIALPQVITMLSALIIPVAIILMMPLITLAYRRVGQGLYCAKCEYEYNFTDPQGPQPPDTCPECGKRWHTHQGLVRGRRWRYRASTYTVVVLIFMIVMGVRTFSPSHGLPVQILPTGALITLVTTPRMGFTNDEWAELNRRTLTTDQTTRLFTELLNLRDEEQFMNTESDAWLDVQVTNRTVSAELIERYHTGIIDLWLVPPSNARVGQPITIDVHTLTRGAPSGARNPRVVIVGYTVNGQPVGDSPPRSDQLEYTISVSSAIWAFGRTKPYSGTAALTLIPDRQGELVVTLDYWIVLVPQFAGSPPVSWLDDNTPVWPPGILHADRRQATITIPVSP